MVGGNEDLLYGGGIGGGHSMMLIVVGLLQFLADGCLSLQYLGIIPAVLPFKSDGLDGFRTQRPEVIIDLEENDSPLRVVFVQRLPITRVI